MRRYQDDLYLLTALAPHDSSIAQLWNLTQPLTIAGIGQLQTTLVLNQGLSPTLQQVTVGFRRGGEKLHLKGNMRHTLKHLFQQWHIPPWERDRLPLLFLENKCIGVVGYELDGDYTAKPGEAGRVAWIKRFAFDPGL